MTERKNLFAASIGIIRRIFGIIRRIVQIIRRIGIIRRIVQMHLFNHFKRTGSVSSVAATLSFFFRRRPSLAAAPGTLGRAERAEEALIIYCNDLQYLCRP